MKKTNTKLLALLLILVFFSTTGAKCGGLPAGAVKAGKPDAVTLQYWKVYQEKSNLDDVINAYTKLNPNVTIVYRNFQPDEYETQLVNALAEDRGPDIFSIQTTWMEKYLTKMYPLPAQITTYSAFQSGTLQKSIYTKADVKNTLTLRDIKTKFPDVVFDNQVINNKVYGLPLSIDTMVLFYNKDLLNKYGIQSPAINWTDFTSQVAKMTQKDAKGNILQAGAAIGTAANINRASDLLSLLMMQSGAMMTDAGGNALINKNVAGYQGDGLAAINALNFYNSFASPSNENYTWNEGMPNSLQAFMAGTTAYYFGYAFDIPTIKTQSKINFEIAAMPQLNETPVNMANYWVETVAQKSAHKNEAWDFILFETTNAANNKLYISKAGLPVALRELIDWQKADNTLEPFVSQLLTARSWYKGANPQAMEDAFKSLITDNLLATDTPEKLLDLAISKINAR